jgi:hypothetical protein
MDDKACCCPSRPVVRVLMPPTVLTGSSCCCVAVTSVSRSGPWPQSAPWPGQLRRAGVRASPALEPRTVRPARREDGRVLRARGHPGGVTCWPRWPRVFEEFSWRGKTFRPPRTFSSNPSENERLYDVITEHVLGIRVSLGRRVMPLPEDQERQLQEIVQALHGMIRSSGAGCAPAIHGCTISASSYSPCSGS